MSYDFCNTCTYWSCLYERYCHVGQEPSEYVLKKNEMIAKISDRHKTKEENIKNIVNLEKQKNKKSLNKLSKKELR